MILKADGITKTFEQNEMVLKGVSLEIERGTFTVLLGPSGSGKTTLLNILSGLLKPTAGSVAYGEDVITSMSKNRLAKWKRNKAGDIFQNYLLLENLTVRENIKIGISPDLQPLSFDMLVEMLEIYDILDKFPGQLSGGQQQRTAIARAVIKKPEILFCDEATGALDEWNSKNVVSLLHRMKEEFGITILFVTHNLQIAKTAERVVTIKDGKLYHDKYNKTPISAWDMVWE